MVVIENSWFDSSVGSIHVVKNILDFKSRDGNLVPTAIKTVQFERHLFDLFMEFDDIGSSQIWDVPIPFFQVLVRNSHQNLNRLHTFSISLHLPQDFLNF